MRQLFEKCKKCNGNGYTDEHAEGYGSHSEDGSCNGSCPVQVQCRYCKATGFMEVESQQKEIEELKDSLDSSNSSFNKLSKEALNISKENTELKERVKELEGLLEINKGVSDGKSIIIKNLENKQ